MGGGLERRCLGRVYGEDGAVHHPHRKHDLQSGSQAHHPSKNSVQKTMCCNSTSNAPDDGRVHHPHRTHDLRSGSQAHHPSKNLVQKTICRN